MKEQQNLSQGASAQTQSGGMIGELSPKEALMKFAKERKYVPNKGLAKYLIYGDEPEKNWEEPLPSWVNDLPDGPALKKAR